MKKSFINTAIIATLAVTLTACGDGQFPTKEYEDKKYESMKTTVPVGIYVESGKIQRENPAIINLSKTIYFDHEETTLSLEKQEAIIELINDAYSIPNFDIVINTYAAANEGLYVEPEDIKEEDKLSPKQIAEYERNKQHEISLMRGFAIDEVLMSKSIPAHSISVIKHGADALSVYGDTEYSHSKNRFATIQIIGKK